MTTLLKFFLAIVANMRGHRESLDFSCKTFPFFFAFAQICFNNGNSRDVEGSISCISGNWIGYAGKKGPYAPFCIKEKMCKKNPPTPNNYFFCGNTLWKRTFGILKTCQPPILAIIARNLMRSIFSQLKRVLLHFSHRWWHIGRSENWVYIVGFPA